MKRREVSSAVGVCMGLILLLQCGHVCAQTAEQIPKPEYYGAYVVDGNNLLRVDVSWSTFSLQKAKIAVIAGVWPARSVTNADVVQLGPNMKFLFYGESPADGTALSTVRPLFFKRNTTTWNGNQRPPQLEKTESANYWEARDEEIKLLIKPIERQPRMVLAVTAKPLADGVYVFNSGHDTLTSQEARLRRPAAPCALTKLTPM